MKSKYTNAEKIAYFRRRADELEKLEKSNGDLAQRVFQLEMEIEELKSLVELKRKKAPYRR